MSKRLFSFVDNLRGRVISKMRIETNKKIDSFCVVPWKHLHICDSGAVKICCATPPLLNDTSNRPLTIYENTVGDIWNSNHMRKIRQAMVRGDAVPECVGFCGKVEANGGESRRMRENKQWNARRIGLDGITFDDLKTDAEHSDFFVNHMPIDLDLEVSNLCNLACRMCTGDRSSKIENDPVHSCWGFGRLAQTKWKHDIAIIGPQPTLNVEYLGFHKFKKSKGEATRWTKGNSKIFIRNVKEIVVSLSVQFSPNMPIDHQVNVRMNGKILYRGCPLYDGLSQTWEIDSPPLVNDLEVQFESQLFSLEKSKLKVGVGIEHIEVKRQKEKGQTDHVFSSRLSSKKHWMKDNQFLYNELLYNPKQIQKIQYVGGEPLINKEVIETFDYLVEKGNPRNLIISFTTNATVFNENVFKKAKLFKKMVVAVSLDGTGDLIEYIRYPVKWSEIEENIKRIASVDNAYIMVSATLQAYNALHIVDLCRFCDMHELPIYINSVIEPEQTTTSVLPPNIRRIAAKQMRDYAESDCRDRHKKMILSHAESLENMGDKFDKDLFNNFMLFTNDLDQSRGQNIRSVCGDLIRLIEKAGLTWTDETRFMPYLTK